MAPYEPGAVWRPYGLRSNPFFTEHLDSTAEVSHGIHLFRGRGRHERAERLVNRIINSDSSIRLIEGPNGIGKTTLANYTKHLLEGVDHVAVYPSIVDVPHSHPRPVEGLAAAILHASLNALRRADDEAGLEAARAGEGLVLDELVQLRGREVGLQHILGYRRSVSQILREAKDRPFAEWRTALTTVSEAAQASGVRGVVIHLNNVDQATLNDPRATAELFGTARDLFQISGFHYILCANEAFRTRALQGRQNILDILGNPIRLDPLDRDDVTDIIRARYDDLRIPGEQLVAPLEAEQFAQITEVFAGDLRAALEAVGQVFMEEIGPSGAPLQFTAQEILALQRPLVLDLYKSLTEFQADLLSVVARLAGPEGRARQSEVVAALKHERPNLQQGAVSIAAESLAASQWLRIEREHARATYYRPGGRTRVILDSLTG